jgi:hypothetical protein
MAAKKRVVSKKARAPVAKHAALSKKKSWLDKVKDFFIRK